MPQQAQEQDLGWDVVEKPKADANAKRPAPPVTDTIRSHAEWFAWAKRQRADIGRAHNAARAAVKASEEGVSAEDVEKAARKGMASAEVVPVDETRQAYSAWFAVAAVDMGLDPHKAHAFADAGYQAQKQNPDLKAATAAAEAAVAGLAAGPAPPRAAPPPPPPPAATPPLPDFTPFTTAPMAHSDPAPPASAGDWSPPPPPPPSATPSKTAGDWASPPPGEVGGWATPPPGEVADWATQPPSATPPATAGDWAPPPPAEVGDWGPPPGASLAPPPPLPPPASPPPAPPKATVETDSWMPPTTPPPSAPAAPEPPAAAAPEPPPAPAAPAVPAKDAGAWQPPDLSEPPPPAAPPPEAAPEPIAEAAPEPAAEAAPEPAAEAAPEPAAEAAPEPAPKPAAGRQSAIDKTITDTRIIAVTRSEAKLATYGDVRRLAGRTLLQDALPSEVKLWVVAVAGTLTALAEPAVGHTVAYLALDQHAGVAYDVATGAAWPAWFDQLPDLAPE